MNRRTVLERADHSGFHMVVNGRRPVGSTKPSTPLIRNTDAWASLYANLAASQHAEIIRA